MATGRGLYRAFLTLLAVVSVTSFPQSAVAQIVRVESRWRGCGPESCLMLVNVGLATVVGKTPEGHSLLLGCRHLLDDPFSDRPGQIAVKGTFLGLVVHGAPASLIAKSETEDLALMRSSGDLGKALPISTQDAVIGDSLVLQGFNQQQNRIEPRYGKVVAGGLACVAKDGDSGGPIIDPKKKAVYGVTISTSAPTPTARRDRTEYVCAREVGLFIKSVVPFGWVMWHDPQSSQATTLPTRSQMPSTGLPPQPTSDLLQKIAALEEKVRQLESTPPPNPENQALTEQQITRTVQAWLTTNLNALKAKDGLNGLDGLPGMPGADATDPQIQRAVAAWAVKNLASIKGKDGALGEQGAPGRVDVVIKWADGTLIQEFKAVPDKSKIAVELERQTKTETTTETKPQPSK